LRRWSAPGSSRTLSGSRDWACGDFDDDVVEFFSPHAASSSFMFVNVFGSRRPRAG
jgi:hypothetical protein